MSDELHVVPPGDGAEPDEAELAALERDLRALFAPTPAPAAFRERLKAELLYGAEHLAPPDTRREAGVAAAGAATRGRLRAPLVALAAHRRTATLISGILAAAAGLLIAFALTDSFGPNAHLHSALAPTNTPTATATATAIATATPTVAPTATARATRIALVLPSPYPSARPTRPPAPTVTPTPPATPTTMPSATPSPTSMPSATFTPRPAPTATTTPVPSVAPPAPRPSSTPTPRPSSTPAPPPTATPTLSPPTAAPTRRAAVHATPIRPTATARPAPTLAPRPTATQPPASPPTHTSTPAPSPTPRPTATMALATATPTSARPAATPAASSTPRRETEAKHPIVVPPLLITPPPAPTPVATTAPAGAATIAMPPTATPRPSATATPRPTATPSLTPSPSPTPSATATATATASPTATETPTATPTHTATATATPNAVLIPLAQVKLPAPSPSNALLSSPLAATTYITQPMAFSFPVSWTLPQVPSQLPVYPLISPSISATDAYSVAQQLGVNGLLMAPQVRDDGSVVATVQVGETPYTLTVYSGYGGAWFTLQSIYPGIGQASTMRLPHLADAWLRAHSLMHSDLALSGVSSQGAVYSQSIGGVPLLGPTSVALNFDGSGVLRDLRYEYVSATATPLLVAAEPPTFAASNVMQGAGGLYSGPTIASATGTFAITGISLAYAGVHGVTGNYLEPIYLLAGTVPTSSRLDPFTMYVTALQ